MSDKSDRYEGTSIYCHHWQIISLRYPYYIENHRRGLRPCDLFLEMPMNEIGSTGFIF